MKFKTSTLCHLILLILYIASPALLWRSQQPSSFNARIGNNNFQFQRSAPRSPPVTFQTPPKRPILFNQPKPKPGFFVKPISESYFNSGIFTYPQFSTSNNNNNNNHQLFGSTLKNPSAVPPQMRKGVQNSNSFWKFSPPKPMKTSSNGNKIAGKLDAPGAYSWGYRWVDESGTAMFREETADGMGTVWGRYSFRETDGRLRIVEYVSDPENGFRTRIRSNEPGIVTSNPANAVIVRFDSEDELADNFDFDFAGRKGKSTFLTGSGRNNNHRKFHIK